MSPKPNWTVGDFTADSVDAERVSIADVGVRASYREEKSFGWDRLPTGSWNKYSSNPVITTSNTGGWAESFIADPWLIENRGTLYMFFEGQDPDINRSIGVAESTDGRNWNIRSDINPVIDNPPNGIAFPYVFRNGSNYYMATDGGPNVGSNGGVNLYKTSASNFPDGWSHVTTLVTGSGTSGASDEKLKDGSIFQHRGVWFLLYAGGPETPDSHRGYIHVETALDPEGPYSKTGYSPINYYPTVAQASPMAHKFGDQILLYDQTMRLRTLSPTPNEYESVEHGQKGVLPSGSGWDSSTTHHISVARLADEWIAAYDGHDGDGNWEVGIATQEVDN